MEDRRLVVIQRFSFLFGVVSGVLLGFSGVATSYEVNTHAELTSALIAQYEAQRGDVFTNAQARALVEGSVAEDSAMRFFNHFYDPVSGEGVRFNEPSASWVHAIVAQANWGLGKLGFGGLHKDKPLFSSKNDHTWQRAVYEYVHGDKIRGAEALGHVIHLVQDASVPAHVRNDLHPYTHGIGDRDYYEEFTHTKSRKDILGIVSDVSGMRVASAHDAIVRMATFTNTSFFSKDTIFKKYVQPQREGLKLERARADGANQYFGVGDYGKLVRILRNKAVATAKDDEVYFLSDKKQEILSENWEVLAREATAYSMGVLDLFFEAVADEKKTGRLLAMNKSFRDTDRFVRALAIERDTSAGGISSLAAADVFELNAQDYAGYFDAAKEYGIHVPTVVRDSVLHDTPPANRQEENTASALTAFEGVFENQNARSSPNAGSIEEPDVFQLTETHENEGAPIEGLDVQAGVQVEAPEVVDVLLDPVAPPTVVTETPVPGTPQENMSPFAPGGFGFGGGGGGATTPTNSQDATSTTTRSTTTSTTTATTTDTTAPEAPVVTSPSDLTQVFYSENFDFGGTAEATSAISFYKNNALITTTDTLETGLWALAGMVLEEGVHDIFFTATDGAGNVSSSTDAQVAVRLIPNTPVLTSPTSTAVATSTVLFSGTATEGNLLTGTIGTTTATTTVQAGDVWTLGEFTLAEGTTAVAFYQTDAGDGDDSLVLEEVITVDTIAPATTTLTILECSFTLRSDGECLSGTEAVHLAWDEVIDAQHYSVVADGTVIATTTATSTTATLPDATTSHVVIRAHDVAGNTSDSVAVSVEVFARPIVIMEVAWAGTGASADNEWIELVNRTGYRMNVDNLQLRYGSGTSTIPLSGFIPSSAFYSSRSYVIERGDGSATTFGEKLAIDFPALSDTGEQLLLEIATSTLSSVIDQTPRVSTCGGWCEGSATSTATMERSDEGADGSLAGSWHTFDGYSLSDYRDANGDVLAGTPGQENSNGYPEFGYFCDPYTSVFEEGGSYAPAVPSDISTKNCTYLTGLWDAGEDRKGSFFIGEVGNATSTNGHSLAGIQTTENGDITDELENGDSVFVAVWKQRSGPAFANDDQDFVDFFEGNASSTPHADYRVLNWIFTK